eukprot:1101540-Rhodomonas_salina.1
MAKVHEKLGKAPPCFLDLGDECAVRVRVRPYAAESNARNRIPGTNCTQNVPPWHSSAGSTTRLVNGFQRCAPDSDQSTLVQHRVPFRPRSLAHRGSRSRALGFRV